MPGGQIARSIICFNCPLLTAPIWVACTLPSLKIISVGMPRMLAETGLPCPNANPIQRRWPGLECAYAHQHIATEQLREVQEYLRSQIPWKSLSSQRMDLVAELLNFWCGEDELDWGYSQYFEIAAGNLKPFLAMTLFTEILCKHFPDVMSAPVKRLSNKL